MEVVGTSGVAALVAVRAGARHSTRLAQGTRVELRLRAALPVQADGETWVQHPARVTITRRGAVPVVLGPGRTHRAVPGAGSKGGAHWAQV